MSIFLHCRSMPKCIQVWQKSYLKNLCCAHGIELVELFDRDDVAIYNSIPTAEGALMMAIQNTDITIHGSRMYGFRIWSNRVYNGQNIARIRGYCEGGRQETGAFRKCLGDGFSAFLYEGSVPGSGEY